MGEGNPGRIIKPNFYNLCRQMTSKRDSLLIVSVQEDFVVQVN